MDVGFIQSIWEDRSDEVGMALVVEFISAQEMVHCNLSTPLLVEEIVLKITIWITSVSRMVIWSLKIRAFVYLVPNKS
jgi:hypothetical protein